jgi:hypothetical protein
VIVQNAPITLLEQSSQVSKRERPVIWEHGALVILSSGGGTGLGEPLDENDERISPTLIVRSRGFAAVHRDQVRIVTQKIRFDAHQSSYEWRTENWIYLEVEAPHPIGGNPVCALPERTDKRIARLSSDDLLALSIVHGPTVSSASNSLDEACGSLATERSEAGLLRGTKSRAPLCGRVERTRSSSSALSRESRHRAESDGEDCPVLWYEHISR